MAFSSAEDLTLRTSVSARREDMVECLGLEEVDGHVLTGAHIKENAHRGTELIRELILSLDIPADALIKCHLGDRLAGVDSIHKQRSPPVRRCGLPIVARTGREPRVMAPGRPFH